MHFELPHNLDLGGLEYFADDVPAHRLSLLIYIFREGVACLNFLEVVARHVHFVIDQVQAFELVAVAKGPDSEGRTTFLTVIMEKGEHFLEAVGHGRHGYHRDLATRSPRDDHGLLGPADRGELFVGAIETCASRLARFDVIKGNGADIGAYNNQLSLWAVVEAVDRDFLDNLNNSDYLIRLFCLLEDPDLVVQAATDEDVNIGLVLGGDKVGDLAGMLAESLHLGPIGGIVQGYIALGVPHYHPFFQEVEFESRNLILGHIHVNSFDVSIQGRPNLDLIAHRGE